MTEVTIVLVTHDRPQWLLETLRSLVTTAARSAATVRILVVDDSSTDAAHRIAYELGVEYLHLPANHGYAAARVIGVQHATGDYLAFFDDDDVAMPDWLPAHLAKAEEGFDVVAGSYIETDANLRRLRTHILETGTLEGLRAGRCPVNDFALIRRSALLGVRWRPDLNTAMMLSLWLSLAAKGARFATVAKPTWYRRLHDANMSARTADADLRAQAIAVV